MCDAIDFVFCLRNGASFVHKGTRYTLCPFLGGESGEDGRGEYFAFPVFKKNGGYRLLKVRKNDEVSS